MRTVCCALTAAVLLAAVAGVQGDFTPATYTVDLALPPKQRWKAAVHGVVSQHGWDDTFGALLGWAHNLPFFDTLLKALSPVFDDVLGYLGPYAGEIEGVWEALQEVRPNVTSESTLGEIVALNAIYSLSAFCTSIVAQHANGTIYHGRNLDYPLPGLRGMTAGVQFMNSSTGSQATLYHGTAFVGYVGLLTGMRPGAFSVSVNQRTVDGADPIGEFIDNILESLEGGQLVGMFLRDALATVPDYPSAVAMLNSTALIAPVYLTVGGVSAGQGAIITRNRDHADDSAGAANGIWRLQPGSGAWYRLETNYDHWKPAGDTRRAVGNKAMQRFAPDDVDLTALLAVLSTPPVLNADTQYTSLMSAATGAFSTLTRTGHSTGHMQRGEDGVWRVQE